MSRHVLLGRCALAKEFHLGGHPELHKSTLITEVNCCAWKGQGATNLVATFVMAAFKLGIWNVNQDARTQLAQIQTMPFPSVDRKMTVVWLVRVRACSGSSRSETCIGCFYLVGGPKPGIVFRDWCGDRNTCVGGKQQIIHRWHAFLDHWHDPHTQPCIQLRCTETVVHTHSEAPPSPSGDTF
jgi:hypothetical protein